MIGALPLAIAAGTTAASYLNKPQDKLSPYLQAALNEISKVQVPDVESLKVKLDQYVQQGLLTPEDAQASLVQYNAMDSANGNATAKGAQMSALQSLQDQIDNGGLTAVDKARIQSTLDEVNNNQRGQDQAITEDSHRRGISGSGLELAQRLMSQQNAASNAGRQGMDIAALEQQAKQQAISDAANLGGNIEGQAFDEQSAKAAAANAINEFNATNQQQVTMANIAARNAAQAANLAEKQNISDANTQTENQNRIRNSGLIEQHYTDQMGKANSIASVMGAQGNAAQKASDANNKWTGELIGGINNAVSAYGANGGFSTAAKPTDAGIRNTGGTTVSLDDAYYKKPLYAAHGATVPGAAPYPGDDSRNDVVPAMVSPGEKILPRSEATDYEKFMEAMPRSEGKPSADAVRLVLQALSGMGC